MTLIRNTNVQMRWTVYYREKKLLFLDDSSWIKNLPSKTFFIKTEFPNRKLWLFMFPRNNIEVVPYQRKERQTQTHRVNWNFLRGVSHFYTYNVDAMYTMKINHENFNKRLSVEGCLWRKCYSEFKFSLKLTRSCLILMKTSSTLLDSWRFFEKKMRSEFLLKFSKNYQIFWF